MKISELLPKEKVVRDCQEKGADGPDNGDDADVDTRQIAEPHGDEGQILEHQVYQAEYQEAKDVDPNHFAILDQVLIDPDASSFFFVLIPTVHVVCEGSQDGSYREVKSGNRSNFGGDFWYRCITARQEQCR